MPYFYDYLSEKNNYLESSFTEITLNILQEYPYEISKCDLLYFYNYNTKKICMRIDQKCISDCEIEKKFMEYNLWNIISMKKIKKLYVI